MQIALIYMIARSISILSDSITIESTTMTWGQRWSQIIYINKCSTTKCRRLSEYDDSSS